MIDDSCNNQPGAGGGNNDNGGGNDKDNNGDKDGYGSRPLGTVAGFLKKKPRAFFKKQGAVSGPIRDTHHQDDREYLLCYKVWSANQFGGDWGDSVSFDHWLDGNPAFIQPNDIRNVSMVQMKQMLLREANDARFKWSSNEMAKDLASHAWFLRCFYTHDYDQERLKELLSFQVQEGAG